MTTNGSFFILGTNHFDTTGNQDAFSVETDVMSEKRQQEIKQVVEYLKKYKPTKIAVEVLKDSQPQLTESYKDYLLGNFKLTRNEVHQIGFRLGQMLGHKDIYGVDWNGTVEAVPDPDEWIAENPSDIYDVILKKGEQV